MEGNFTPLMWAFAGKENVPQPKSTVASQFQWGTLNLDNPTQDWLDESEPHHLSPPATTSPHGDPHSELKKGRGCFHSNNELTVEPTTVRGRPGGKKGLQGRRGEEASRGGRSSRKMKED